MQKFVEKANIKHNFKYKYDHAIYINLRTKLLINCLIHGQFLQTPDSHLRGHGCLKCGIEKRSILKTKTTEQFIKEANEKHNSFYNYDKTVYTKSREQVLIGCPIKNHGYFLQIANDHLNGSGCPKCVGQNKTTDELIEQFIEVHENVYNYDNVIYNGHSDKVQIWCYIHGLFLQTPTNHLQGYGCQQCANNQLKTKEQVIKEFNEKHNYCYLYDRFDFVNMATKALIGCKVGDHGYFEQMPYSHKDGHGCNKCKIQNLCRNIDDLKNEFNEIHDNKYDYSKFTIYENTGVKIPIICPYHGSFLQEPRVHLAGAGCRKCADKYKTQEQMIEAFIEKHNINFNYDKVVYVNYTTNVLIGCKKVENHGYFELTPSKHLSGSGCQKCNCFINQNESINILEKLTNVEFKREQCPKFLKQLRYDCYNDTLKLALEYNGIQHYEFHDYFHRTYDKFTEQQKRDLLKIKLSKENGIFLIIVPYTENKNKKEFIKNQLYKYYFQKCLELIKVKT